MMIAVLANLSWPGLSGAAVAPQPTADSARTDLPAYQAPRQVVAGDVELSVTDVTLRAAERLVAALQPAQPALQIRLHPVSTTVTARWWRKDMPPRAALLAQSLPADVQADFERTWGYEPTALALAGDAVAVVVHPDNPVARRGLSLAELDAMFSVTRNRGHTPLRDWSDLEPGDAWRRLAIAPIGQVSTSALTRHFRDRVLLDGAFRAEVARLAGSGAVTRRVAGQRSAIGYAAYSGLGGATAVVPLARQDGADYVKPSRETIAADAYPLSYVLNLYVNHRPGTEVSPPLRELLRFCYSREGQEALMAAGYTGITADAATDDLRQLDLDVR